MSNNQVKGPQEVALEEILTGVVGSAFFGLLDVPAHYIVWVQNSEEEVHVLEDNSVRSIHLEVLKLYSESLPAMLPPTRTKLPLTILYMQMMTLAAF